MRLGFIPLAGFVVILLALLIAFVFILDNDALPTGPDINSVEINNIDVSNSLTPVVLNVDHLSFSGNATVTALGTHTAGINITSGGSGCDGVSFVTTGSEASCDSERVLTGTSDQVIVTDNGADTTLVLSLPQSIALTSDVIFNDVQVNGRLNFESVSEFCEVDAPATIECSTRDNFIFMLDSNANSTSDLCIRSHGGSSDVWCVDEAGVITLATIDGDVNTVIDLGWGDLDFVDSPADEECVTIEGADDFEAQPCGGLDVSEFFLRSHSGVFAGTGIDGIIHTAACLTLCVPITSEDFTSSSNQLIAYPIFIGNAGTFGGMTVSVESADAVTTSARVGVYASAGDASFLYPGALVEDYGTFSVATSGQKIISCTTCVAFDPGIYFLVLVTESNTVTFKGMDTDASGSLNWGMPVGINTITTGLGDATTICSAGCGSLPDPFTTDDLHRLATSVSCTLWIAVEITD